MLRSPAIRISAILFVTGLLSVVITITLWFSALSGSVEPGHCTSLLQSHYAVEGKSASKDGAVPAWPDIAWPLFIGYTWDFPVLKQTLGSFAAAKWPGIVVVDNSRGREAWKAQQELRQSYGIVAVIDTPAPLSFPQLQEFFATLAAKWGVPWYFWAHGDVYFLPSSSEPYQAALACICASKRRRPGTHAAEFSGSGALMGMDTLNTLQRVPWDPYLEGSLALCELRQRLSVFGHTIAQCDIGSVMRVSEVLNASTLQQLSSSSVSHIQKVGLLVGRQRPRSPAPSNIDGSGAECDFKGPGGLPYGSMRRADVLGLQARHNASVEYYARKYQFQRRWWANFPNFDVTSG